MDKIPDSLVIHLHTSIPGYNRITLKSENLIPSILNQSICFDPLIKLDQKIIDGISIKDRARYFYDQKLFKKLSNSRPVSIEDSVKTGTIDDNIKLTLECIFSDYALFYLDKDVYTIIDALSEPGTWGVAMKYDTKIDKESNKDKNTATYLLFGPNFINLNEPTDDIKYYKTNDKNRSSYHIVVYLELYAGSKMPEEEKDKCKCRKQWNRVRKAYATFAGKDYQVEAITRHVSKSALTKKLKKNRNANKTKKN